jgi:hypothetical protein
VNKIDIELTKWEFWGADTVTGTVVLELDRPTPIRGIRIWLYGYEEASWSGGKNSYEEQNVLVDEEVTLHGQGALSRGQLIVDSIQGFFTKNKYEQLPAGEYRYPFSLKLPENIPGSYTSKIGEGFYSKVDYSLRAQADLPLKIDLCEERSLDVFGPQPAEGPKPVSARQTGHSLLGGDTIAELAVYLDKDAYRPGEQVLCRLEVTNHSPSKKLRGVKVAVQQVEKGRAHRGRMMIPGKYSYRQDKEVAGAEFRPKELRFKETTRGEFKMDLPEELAATMKGNVVKVAYQVEATLEIPWAKDVVVTLPIKILPKKKPLSKAAWRERLAKESGPKGRVGLLDGLPAEEFKKAMGPPDDTNTTDGIPFWYYDCADGMIQLELDGPDLNERGMLRGKIHEED